MRVKSPFPDIPSTPEVNVYQFLWNRPDQEQWPKDFAFHIDAATGNRQSFQDIYKRTRLGATALGAPISQGGLGIKFEDGEIVGIMSQNMSDYVTLVHSLLAITTPFALIPSYSTPFELAHILRLTKTTRLFVNAQLLSTVLPVAEKCGIPQDRIYILGEGRGRKSFNDMIELVKSRGTLDVPIRPAKKDTLAYLILSSGTTGLPKAVMISHGNQIFLLQQVDLLAKIVSAQNTEAPPTEPNVSLAALPMHHSYGLQISCFNAFLIPQTYVILPQWNLEVALRAIPKYKINSLLLVPSYIHQIVNYSRLKDIDFNSVQSVFSGGAFLPPELAMKLTAVIERDFNFRPGYGMSEITASAVIKFLSGSQLAADKGDTGVLLPNLEARVVREDGSETDVDEVGELYLKGPTVALGYFGNPEATAETFVDGWLRTGDLFTVNKDGILTFVDRAKDTLKVSGSQVSPNEIENVLLGEPGKLILDACVAGVSGGRTSDEKVPRAWIVLSEAGKKLGGEETVRVLEKWQRENLSRYKWLRGGIEVVNKIPKSPTGKVLRRQLRDEYEHHASKTGPRGKL